MSFVDFDIEQPYRHGMTPERLAELRAQFDALTAEGWEWRGDPTLAEFIDALKKYIYNE